MTTIYLISGLLCVALCGVPAVRADQAGEILMTASTMTLLVVYLGVVLLCVKPLGLYMAHVMDGARHLAAARWRARGASGLPRRRRRSGRGDGLEALRAGAAAVQHPGRTGGLWHCSGCSCGCP